jgi:hypothetical protein
MTKMTPVTGAMPAAPARAFLLDKIASALGCSPSAFLDAPSEHQEQSHEMVSLWYQLSSTKAREEILTIMRGKVAQTNV